MTHAAEDTDSPRSSRIKLHGPADFEGMRKAGRLTAEALDLLVPHVKPGVTTDELDSLIVDFARDHNAIPAPLQLPGLPQVDLHLDQPRRLPWHSQRQAAARRRHRQHRRDAHRRWLARRLEPHVHGGRSQPQGRAAGRGHLRVPDARHRHGEARRPSGRHRLRHPDLCRGRALLRRARLLRPWPRPRLPRPSQRAALWPHGRRRGTEARHVLHDRADDQSRPPACEDPRRRLDRRHPRPLALGPVRAYRRRDRDRRARSSRSRPRASITRPTRCDHGGV